MAQKHALRVTLWQQMGGEGEVAARGEVPSFDAAVDERWSKVCAGIRAERATADASFTATELALSGARLPGGRAPADGSFEQAVGRERRVTERQQRLVQNGWKRSNTPPPL